MDASTTGSSFGDDTAGSIVGDVGSLSWVTTLLGVLWPRLNDSLAALIHDKVTPQLQHALPPPFKGARFSRFSMGKGVPRYGEIEVTQRSDDHVQVEVDLAVSTEADILLELGVGGICFGVRRIRFSGRLCVALKPLMSTLPLAGAVQIFFAAQPRIEMRFAGLAAIAEIPGLERKLYSVVEDLLRNTLVLPNTKTIQLAKDEQVRNMTEAYSHKPLGALRVRVLRARNLAGTNWQMGNLDAFSSDPYCVLRLGTASTRTSTVRGSTSPTWPETDPAAYFPVYHHDQELEIEVRDEGKGLLNTKFVSFLGKVTALRVRDLFHSIGEAGPAEHTMVLDTSRVSSAMLHVNDPVNRGVPSELDIVVEWANALPSASADRTAGPLAAFSEAHSDDLLMVEMHSGSGFPSACLEKGLRWRCYWDESEEFPVTSQRGTPHQEKPDYEDLPVSLRTNKILLQVIDRLALRGDSVVEIGAIVDYPPLVVMQYLKAKAEFERRVWARQQQDKDRTEVRWHQTLSLPLPRSSEARLVVQLLEGERVVGALDTFLLQERMNEGKAVTRQRLKLLSTGAKSLSLASWIFPECGRGAGHRGRFQEASMEVSLRFQHFARGVYLGAGPSGILRQLSTPMGSSCSALGARSRGPSELGIPDLRESGADTAASVASTLAFARPNFSKQPSQPSLPSSRSSSGEFAAAAGVLGAVGLGDAIQEGREDDEAAGEAIDVDAEVQSESRAAGAEEDDERPVSPLPPPAMESDVVCKPAPEADTGRERLRAPLGGA